MAEYQADPFAFKQRRLGGLAQGPDAGMAEAARRELATLQESRPRVELLDRSGGVIADYARGERIPESMRGSFGGGNLQATSLFGPGTPDNPPIQTSAAGLATRNSGVSMMPGLDEEQRRIAIRNEAGNLALSRIRSEQEMASMPPERRAELQRYVKMRPEMAALEYGQHLLGSEQEYVAREVGVFSDDYAAKWGRPAPPEALAAAARKAAIAFRGEGIELAKQGMTQKRPALE
jgi:hypothetical protein